jgi:hypothetical protein
MTKQIALLVVGIGLVGVCAGGCVGQPATTPPPTNDVYSVELTAATPSSLLKCTSALAGNVAYVASPPSLWSCRDGRWDQIPCTTGLSGSVAYASTTKALWACVGSTWTQIALPAAGPQGPQGPTGPAGDAGPPGPQGPAGLTGTTGAQGAAGPTGATGATGPQGPAGDAGAQGPVGVAGAKSLVSVTTEPPGSHCAGGGERIDVGIDVNGNGTLDLSEVQNTAYICNGAPGPVGPAGPQGPTGPTGAPGASDTMDAQSRPEVSDAVVNETGAAGAGGADGGSDAAQPPSFPAPHPDPPLIVRSPGGPVLSSPKVTQVFFANDDPAVTAQLSDFGGKITQSSYFGALSEYGVSAGSTLPDIHLMETTSGTTTDAQIQVWLSQKLSGSNPGPKFPAPDANTVFIIYYPAEVSISLGGPTSCIQFGAYHSSITLSSGHVAYVVVPRCSTYHGLSGIDATTAAVSASLADAVTDPYPQDTPAWATYDDAHAFWALAANGSELADECALEPSSFVKLPDLAYTVQRVWSNKAAMAGHDWCVPQPSGDVNFGAEPVLPDSAQFTQFGLAVTVKAVSIPAGQSRTIDVDLFSDAATSGPWTVDAFDNATVKGQQATLTFAFDHTTGVNGDKMKLTIHTLIATQGGTPFFVRSTLGQTRHLWIGFVSH